ncbi:MAG: phosphoribosyltransferase family protein [Planctomycetota bacterium]|nr:phosphoribosyltransferase family protein [Planctomycetota bacterium]
MAQRATALPARFRPLIRREQIASRLATLAPEVYAAMAKRHRPIAVIVLQGAFVFAADLLRRLPSDFKIEVAFLRCESYGSATRSSGRVLLLQDIEPDLDLRGRTVLLIDDILDTGLTLGFLVDHLRKRGAGEIRSCVLLRRHLGAGAERIRPDFAGFEVGGEFVVGYGLDYESCYRNLPDLAALVTGPEPAVSPRKRRR